MVPLRKGICQILIVYFTLAIITIGCNKKEEAPKTSTHSPMTPVTEPMKFTVPKDITIIVPDEVKAMWKKVKILVEDKTTKKTKEYVVNVGGELNIPGTNLKIVVVHFIPDFKMDGATITSASVNPNNPAARVEIFEDGKSIFKGWLYSKFPTIHPFEHDRYSIILIDGLKG